MLVANVGVMSTLFLFCILSTSSYEDMISKYVALQIMLWLTFINEWKVSMRLLFLDKMDHHTKDGNFKTYI